MCDDSSIKSKLTFYQNYFFAILNCIYFNTCTVISNSIFTQRNKSNQNVPKLYIILLNAFLFLLQLIQVKLLLTTHKFSQVMEIEISVDNFKTNSFNLKEAVENKTVKSKDWLCFQWKKNCLIDTPLSSAKIIKT